MGILLTLFFEFRFYLFLFLYSLFFVLSLFDQLKPYLFFYLSRIAASFDVARNVLGPYEQQNEIAIIIIIMIKTVSWQNQ